MKLLREFSLEHQDSQKLNASDEIICWSRMQAEAGQGLDKIIARKEREREAGAGLFFWGVGNAPAVMTKSLAKLQHPISIVFSVMKSKPKPIDVTPTSRLVWRRYIDCDGVERDLPANALVTSRGETKSASKKHHYALMCFSAEPLALIRGIPFDPTAYRNVGGNGAAVGASQVTAMVRRTGSPSTITDYEANLQAKLTGSYWVRLSDPVLLSAEDSEMLEQFVPAGVKAWLNYASRIRHRPRSSPNYCLQQAQLPI